MPFSSGNPLSAEEFRTLLREELKPIEDRLDEASEERELMWAALLESLRQEHRTLKEVRAAMKAEKPSEPTSKGSRAERGAAHSLRMAAKPHS